MEPQLTDQDKIKSFVETFFRNLGSLVEWKGPLLHVSNIPEEFEKFAGKKGPYQLAFSLDEEGENTEVMSRSNFLLQAMMNYLDDRGQTTLLKIALPLQPKEIIEQKLKLKNAAIQNLSLTEGYRQFARFTFLSMFQYLNDKDQVLSQVVIEDGVVSDRDLESYTLVEGKKEDIKLYDVESAYNVARQELKKLLNKKTQDVALTLKTRLEKEIERIKAHYTHQYAELGTELQKQAKQLTDLEAQQSKQTHADPALVQRIARLKESLAQENAKRESIQKEEEFFINDEMRKHALNLSNKLINTSIVYYPVYRVNLMLRNEDSARIVEFVLDPIRESPLLFCESCKTVPAEIVLCVSGHISCMNCLSKCQDCRKPTCHLCQERPCHLCGKSLCKKCSLKCPRCGKVACKQSMQLDHLSGRQTCMACLRKCYRCNNYASIDKFKPSVERSEQICEKCFRNESVKRRLSPVDH